MTIKITTRNAKEYLLDVLKAGLVPMLTSSPGLGKSSIAAEIAKEAKLKLIDIRLAQCDPTDLNGFPTVNSETNKSSYLPMDTFPIEGDPLPEGYSGWLMLFDEITSATLAVQGASYKIIHDRMINQFKLHSSVALMAAGNLTTDRAVVNRISTALQSRMIHFEMEADTSHWSEWAGQTEIDHRVQSFINFKPNSLHMFDPDHNDKTFACPRTWEFVSKIIKDWSDVNHKKIPVIAGAIGEGMAREFIAFCGIYQSLPTIQEFLHSPETVSISPEPSIKYAITGLLSNHMSIDNIDKLMIAVMRLPIEFQIICLRPVLKRIKGIQNNVNIRKWIALNAQDLV